MSERAQAAGIPYTVRRSARAHTVRVNVHAHAGVEVVLPQRASERAAAAAVRELRKDKISGWRWLLGAWGVGTYRQDDSVDVRYEAADGSPRVAEALEIEAG